MRTKLANLFANLYLPVIVCENTKDFPVIYMNIRAALLISPTYSTEELANNVKNQLLCDVINFENKEEYANFCRTIQTLGHVDDYLSKVSVFNGQTLKYNLSAKTISFKSPNDCIVIYLTGKDSKNEISCDNRLTSIINAAFIAEDTNTSIRTVLALAGRKADASRAYIFEELSETMTGNTYEWCAPGIEPVIHELSNLKKADYNYDVIVHSGMYISEDVDKIEPDEDRELLKRQGIKSLAIVTLYDKDRPLGYVGFDDCEKKRKWSHLDIQFLKSVSSVLSLLIKRRNTEEELNRAHNIFNIISDNSGDIIYAVSVEDCTVKYVSKSMADVLNTTTDELLHKPCWQVFQKGKEGVCDFCPMPILEKEDNKGSYVWDHTNSITKRSYLMRSNLVNWVDGEKVHLVTATDITERIKNEQELKRIASRDAMTGVYNREWGGKLLADLFAENKKKGSLCFIDVDGLKHTNDTFGHDAGDELLKNIVNILSSHIKEDEIMCRWGGDEFLIWFERTPGEAKAVLKKAQAEMKKINDMEKRRYKLSFSYGVKPFIKEKASTFDNIVTQADELMYKNKMHKRGIVMRRRRTD